MEPQNILALIVAYHLSKFDQSAYLRLGFDTRRTAHREIGAILGVKPNTLKNMRDEFDSIHDNSRVGWYQRELRPSRRRIVECFQLCSRPELQVIVESILANPHSIPGAIDTVIARVRQKQDLEEDRESRAYVVRGPTGRKAEISFVEYFTEYQLPRPGRLKDTRDLGVGYDFEIHCSDEVVLVEVKGLAGQTGGVLLTGKEWEIASQAGERYYLAIVRNVDLDPEIQFFQDPVNCLRASKNIYPSIRVNWSISERELSRQETRS